MYHWSPAERYESIVREGLVPGKGATVSSRGEPHLCFGTNPAMAWSLSGAMDWVSQIDEWDLWMIPVVGEHTAVHVRAFWGDEIEEVRIEGPVAPGEIWYVGRRTA